MIEIGKINTLEIVRKTKNGVYLDDGESGILLPNQYLPQNYNIGDSVDVFIYHDNEARLIATTIKPIAVVGDIAKLKVVDINEQGAFMNIGIMKDIFIHKTNMLEPMKKGYDYWVKIYIDKVNDRITASQRLEDFLSNKTISIREKQVVQLIAYRKTEIGIVAVINKEYLGLLHYNEVFKPIQIGDEFEGFIKKIHPKQNDTQGNYKIDVSLGKIGYNRVEDESQKILRLMNQANGFLPFHDKSKPEDIYNYFGMSKKTFKMTIGKLYKSGDINLLKDGIELVPAD